MEKNLLAAIKKRRTFYSIGNEKIVSDNKITEIISEAIKHCPSAFNSQSARVLLLLNENHLKLWKIVKQEIKKIAPKESFEQAEAKINNSFESGYGTILFFEDENAIKALEEKFPPYKENFIIWANQSSGMLQFIIWTALEQEGLGASLQHYNPLIDDIVKNEWGLPNHYKLIAQMPFGKPLAPPDEKDFLPIENRFKIFK